MAKYICITCGAQFAETEQPPGRCPVCEDERQYVGWNGQQWTTLAEMQGSHHNVIRHLEPDLWGVGTHPEFAIAQRALLVRSAEGNVLWDCISLIDEATVTVVQALGGITAIAISHPHYYSSMVEWSRTFDAPILLHGADRQWVMRPDSAIEFWEGETKPLWSGLTLIRCGGHFEGGTVLHWPAGAEGRGALLSGDILQVTNDRRWVSFMYSYPNYIPLPAHSVQHIVAAVEPYRFDRIYGAWWNREIQSDGKAAAARSARRYLAALAERDGS